MTNLKNIFAALSRAERLVFALAALFAISTGAALASLAVGRITVVVPAHGGTFTEGLVGQPTYVNPLLAESDADKGLVHLLFGNVLDLAEKAAPNATGRAWNVRLKEDLHWSDGHKITSDDVIFTVEKIQDPETRSPLYSSWQGVSVSRLSELEVQFTLVSPYPFFRDNLIGLYPIPKHLFADTPSANWRLSDYNLKPVGSGPYMFASYNKRDSGFIQSYDLTTNPAYSGDRAFIDRFAFRFFSRADEVIDAFNAGMIDGFGDFDPESITKLDRSYNIFSFTVPSYYAVFLNQSQNLAFKEPEVRIALGEGIDRGALVSNIFHDRARIAQGPLVDTAPQTVDNRYRPDEANQLLDAALWQPNADGVREKTVGGGTLRLEFDLVVPKIPFMQKTAGALRDAWSALGVKANIVELAPEDLTNRVIKNREYQALLFGNFLSPAEDLYPFWHSNERFYPGLNLALYGNKKADQLIESIRREPDGAKRGDEVANLSATIMSDAPAVFLYSPNYLFVARRDLQGIESMPLADPTDRYATVSAWHLKTTRALK